MALVIHACRSCGTKNRVPEKYKGIPVCASCKQQLFETVLTTEPAPKEEKPAKVRTDWRSKIDRHKVALALLISVPIHWFLLHQWVWSMISNFVITIAVCLLVISALVGVWLIAGFAIKVGWEEIWETRQMKKNRAAEDDTVLLDIGPWDMVTDYLDLIRNKAHEARYRFTLRKV